MKKNGIAKKLLLFSLIAVMMLTMQGMSVLAGAEQPESQPETLEGQPEEQSEISERQSVSQNELPGVQSVSQNGLSERQSVSQNGLPKLQAGNQSDAGIMSATVETLTPDILKKCIVPAQNPQGVTVNLFDYWQDWQGSGKNPEKEVMHDYWVDDSKSQSVTTYNLGISQGHLLRFGYRDNGECSYCNDSNDLELDNYGAWNQYNQSYGNNAISGKEGQLYPGIVQNRLGTDGFPKLNFGNITDNSKFGQYAAAGNEEYLKHKEESLAYLFSLDKSYPYRDVYTNVMGLFQQDSDGYYRYDSTKNFASYDIGSNSFILYNSPGVAKEKDNAAGQAEFCGQFFPFNTAQQVFDKYILDTNGNYRLTYDGPLRKDDDTDDIKASYAVTYGNNSYIKCYAPVLNHYLGMTLEVTFLQPENGLVNGKPMTFEFSGDDDVWIFIDDVLVADLGGLHDAYSLKIDFYTGNVYVERNGAPYNMDGTLLTSFKSVYGDVLNPGGVAFNNNTFADNTSHTLKMFYLERGHMASNLSLSFNIQNVNTGLVNTMNQDGSDSENAETEPYSEEDAVKVEESILPAADTTVTDSVGMPQTGDDSMIWWWAVLCIASFIGICAVVCNLILVRRKQKKIITEGKRRKHSSRK